MIDRLRRISYFCAYVVATIPLWHYIRDGRILAAMIAVVAFAYVMVVLSSVQAAQPIFSSEKAKTSLPRWLPDKPKYHKWWLIIRHTLKWHLLLVPPKMGLALGFAEWLHLGAYATSTGSILRPYLFGSRISSEQYPQLETFGIALVFLILFTIAESGCISSLILITSKSKKLIILRLLIALSIIGVMNQYQEHIYPNIPRFARPDDEISTPTLFGHILDIRTKARIRETVETGFLVLSGMDVLHSANIMRLDYHEWIWDNRPYVARQVVAGLLGLILYAGATWVILWFVEDE